MWSSVRKDVFIKHNMPGDVYSKGGLMKTQISFLRGAVTDENTQERPKIKFVFIVGA